MKNQIILTILTLFLNSCDYAQETKEISEIQEFFNVKGSVEEIQTTSKVFTTMGERNL